MSLTAIFMVREMNNILAKWGLLLFMSVAISGNAFAAVGNFFFAGFNVEGLDLSEQDRRALEVGLGVLGGAASRAPQDEPRYYAFASERTGAMPSILRMIKWDDFEYNETASRLATEQENLSDIFGIYISIDKAFVFRPKQVELVAGTHRSYATYVFVSVNIFAADNRTVVFSYPALLVGQSPTQPRTVDVVLDNLEALARALKDPANPLTARLARHLQDYFGMPGQSKELRRRSSGETQAIYGVEPVCRKCIDITDETSRAGYSSEMLGEFLQYYLHTKMSEYRRVSAPTASQRRRVSERTADVARTGMAGATAMNYSDSCSQGRDDLGVTTICVHVPGPKFVVRTGIRGLVGVDATVGGTQVFRYRMIVDIGVEKDNGLQATNVRGDTAWKFAATTQVSDDYYVAAIIRTLNSLSSANFP